MIPLETTSALFEIDTGELVSEVESYLAAVELFRAEGREPVWASDEWRPDALGGDDDLGRSHRLGAPEPRIL